MTSNAFDGKHADRAGTLPHFTGLGVGFRVVVRLSSGQVREAQNDHALTDFFHFRQQQVGPQRPGALAKAVEKDATSQIDKSLDEAAITLGAFLLPLATFYALTSFLLGAGLASLLAILGAYGFTIAALLVPAVFEFDVATGRTSTGDERE